MALRAPVFATPTISQQDEDAFAASGMSSLRRGYEAGRIGTDINAAAAQEASLRRAAEQGDAQALAEAEALRANIGGLQRRQAMYAPEVGKVEDINSLGTFGSWAAGQVGQGAASVQDPLAVGAALQGAGTLLSAGPGVMKGVGAGLRGAGYAVPFLMNQRQMTGEAYNAMAEDEALMARTSAAERERNANLYGAGAGALDTVVPGMIAGKLTGAGLRQGIAKSGLGARMLGGMGMEGTTEALQQFGQQQTLGYMNPDRDTSGDFMENVNAFAGGAIGAGPMVMAGEMADGGYRRVGDTAQKVSEKTGEVVDLLSEKAEPYVGKAKGKLDKVVDLFAGEDGKVTPSSIKDKVTGKAKDVYADFEARAAERDVISGMPPDGVDANDREAYGQWYTENAPKRMQTVADKLGKMVEDGDEQAAKIYEGLTSQDDETRANALEEGASHILNQDEWAQFGQEAERRAKQASRWANKFGKMAGAAGRAVGGAAVDFGKSVVSGAMKKNAQGMEGESLAGADNIYDPEAIRKRDFALDKEAENWNEARQRSFNRAKIMSEFMAEELKVAQAMPASRMGGRNVVGGVAPEAMTGFMKDMGLEIADLAENWHATPKKPAKGNAPSGPMSTLKNPADSKGQQYNGLKLSLNRIVRSLKLAYGERAQQVINELQAIDQNSAPELFDVMREELTVQQGPRAARHNAEVEREAQSAVIDAMGQDVESRLIEQGVNVREAGGRKKLFEMVKAVDDGVAPPAAVRALEKLVGKDRLLAMRSTLRPAEASRDDLIEDNGATLDSGVTVNDDGEVEVAESNQLDKALGETKRDRMGAKRMVGFRGTQRVRLEGGDKRDVFAAAGGVTGEDMLKFQDEFSRAMEEGKAPSARPAMPAGMRRPRLAFRGDTFTGGEDAVEGSRARFERRIGAERTPDAMIKALRAEGNEKGAALAESMLKEGVNLDARSRAFFENRSEGGKWAVNSVSVKDYLDEEGADPLRRVALYRDYIQQAAYAKDVSPEEHQSMSALARRLSTVVGDMAGERAGKGGKLRTSPMDRKEAVAAADRYFAEHFVNVADQATDAIPEQISAGEIDAMAEMGKRMLDSARKGRGENAPFNFPVLSKKNLIIFEHRDKDNKGKAVYVQIPANRLAAWGNFQRTAMEGTKEQGHKADKDQTFSNTDKDMDFLLGLTVGIQAIRTSGVVKNAFPTKVNAIGGVEKFQSTGQLKGALQILDGLPPSLELATMTVEEADFEIEKGSERYRNEILPKLEEYRAKNSIRIEMQNDAKKLGEWSAEPFVAKQDEDELPPGEVWGNLSHHVEAAGGRMSTDKSRSDTPRAQPTGGASRPKAFVEGPIDPISGKPEYRGRINVATPDVSRTFKSSATGGWDARGTTYEPGPTPSDFSAPEGFEDVRDRTKAQGRSALQRSKGQLGPETPLTASKMAETRAQTIRAALIDDGLEALAIINRRLRQAEQPRWGADKNSVVGGAQYAIPIIKALDDDTLAQFDTDDELKALRDKAVEIVRGSDLPKALKAEFAPETGTKPAAKGVGASLGNPSGVGETAGTKFNRQSEGIHMSLAREGFAATHDSPIRHEGKFDWRAHIGKGEGNAAFGAGTYLSTADGVHKNYKDMFTGAVEAGYETLRREIRGIEGKLDDARESYHALKEVFIVNGERMSDRNNWRVSGTGALTYDDRYATDGEMAGDLYTLEKRPGSGHDLFVNGEFQERVADLGEFFESNKPSEQDYARATKLEAKVAQFERELAAAEAEFDKAKAGKFGADKSPTYQVSVNIEDDQLLDWNKPLNEQSALVQKALAKMLDDAAIPSKLGGVNSIRVQRNLGARDFGTYTGSRYYSALATSLGSQAKASDYLQSLGILGHRYAAAGGKNDTHPNYVIYDDKRITTNYVHFNKQGKVTPESTKAERDAAVAEVIKTLGKDIDVRFEQTTGYSGAYLDKEAAIVISLTPAAGTLQTAYHEALHAFVARLVRGNDKAKRVLDSLVNHAPTMERVRALLADHPEALKQLIDGEERLAYIYQFWRAGLLDLPETQGTGLLQKLRRFFRGMLGRISDLERSSDLLGAFARGSYAGDVSVAGKVMAKTLAEGTWSARNMRKMDGLVQKVAAMTAPAQSLLLISDSKTAQKLGNTFWTNPGDEESGDMKEGYLNARERMAKRYTNEFSRIVRDLSERDHKDVITYLQKETDPADIPYQPHREAVEKIRALLQRFWVYMTDERGMKIGDRGPLYFPRVWSPHRLTEKKADFIAMMKTNHPTFDAEAVYNAVLSKFEQNTEDSEHGREDEDAVLKPTQSAGNKRILDFITGEQAQPFLEQSLVGALSRYFHEGARAAEYTARFGQTGKKLEKALSMIHAELRVAGKKRRDDGELADQDAETKWVERQMRDVNAAVDAMEGTLGRDISDGWRKTNSWVTVYQNVRLLPMALFSSIVDPLGMVARGAPMREAYDGFLRGMSEVVANWGEMITGKTKEHKVDKWERLAMAVGSVDAAVFNHHVSDEYASVFMSAGAKKINDFMFKANGMEAWNRGMRVAATKSAAMFITRHKSLPDTHSERWLQELGLKPADVYTTPDGELITNKHVLAAQEGIDVDDAAKRVEKVHYAINRWVQGAVLTPNAAQRPAWGSDPHYSMFFHLKQFSYSFHQTILKRAVKEMNHGNLAPLGAFVWYIPVMIASDITKGLIQGGGELPAHMKGMDLGDWVAHGAERAGLLGLGQVGVDANQDLASIGGPAVEQIIDAFSDPLERTMIKAAPAHGLYAEALK